MHLRTLLYSFSSYVYSIVPTVFIVNQCKTRMTISRLGLLHYSQSSTFCLCVLDFFLVSVTKYQFFMFLFTQAFSCACLLRPVYRQHCVSDLSHKLLRQPSLTCHVSQFVDHWTQFGCHTYTLTSAVVKSNLIQPRDMFDLRKKRLLNFGPVGSHQRFLDDPRSMY